MPKSKASKSGDSKKSATSTISSKVAPTSTTPKKPAFGSGKRLNAAFLNGTYARPKQSSTAAILQQVRNEVKHPDPPGKIAYEKPVSGDDNKRIELGIDAYSIMMLHGFGRQSFWCFFILMVQILFVLLFYYDLLRGATEQNTFNLPNHQATHMQVSQFLALLVVPYFLGDVTAALVWLGMRYEPIPDHPAATAKRWYWVLFLRLMVGTAEVFVAFLLIMQSTSLTILFLNVQSLLFVSTVDHLFIWLAYHGFLRELMEEATRTAEKVGWTRKIETRKAIRGVIMVILWLMLILGWTFVSMSYSTGIYLVEDSCKTFAVQFDDLLVDETIATFTDLNYNSSINQGDFIDPTFKLRYSHFAGTYRIGLSDPNQADEQVDRLFARFDSFFPIFEDDRLVYYQDFYVEREDDDLAYDQFPYQGKFSFCSAGDLDTKVGWWVFTVESLQGKLLNVRSGQEAGDGSNTAGEEDDDDRCNAWLMRSPLTESVYTLQDVSTDGWTVWTNGGIVEMSVEGSSSSSTSSSVFDLVCEDCATNVDCGFRGTCKPNDWDGDVYQTCDCDNDRLGPQCDVGISSCQELVITLPNAAAPGRYARLTKEGTAQGEDTVAADLLTISGRPLFVDFDVYSSLAAAVTAEATLNCILYAATRWYHGSIPAKVLQSEIVDKNIPETSHPIWDGFVLFQVDYATNPTRRGSPAASQLQWLPVEILKDPTTGLTIDHLVHDNGPDVGDIVDCSNRQDFNPKPYFDAITLCDPTFLDFDVEVGACPVDLTDLAGTVSGFARPPNTPIDGVSLLFDNNDVTYSSYPSSAGVSYTFTFDLAEPIDEVSFVGYSIHFGNDVNLEDLFNIRLSFCEANEPEFTTDCALFLSEERNIESNFLTVELPRNVQRDTRRNLLGRIVVTLEYNGNASGGTDLDIKEIRVYGLVQ